MLGHALSVCQYDEALDCGALVLQAGHEVHKHRVQHDVLILSMVDNVLQVCFKQPARCGFMLAQWGGLYITKHMSANLTKTWLHLVLNQDRLRTQTHVCRPD